MGRRLVPGTTDQYIEDKETLLNDSFQPPPDWPYETTRGQYDKSCGVYDEPDAPTNYIEYWKCGSYAFYGENKLSNLNTIASKDTIIDNRNVDGEIGYCKEHSSVEHEYYDQAEGWTYITGGASTEQNPNLSAEHSIGYRDKDSERSLASWITEANAAVLTSNCISANWINALSTSLSTEIRARLQNHLYSDKQDDVNLKIDCLTPDQNFVDGNVITKLREAMNLLSTGVSGDNGANLQDSQSVIPNSKNIQTTTSMIAKTEVKKFIDDCVIAYKDCICYSDCGGYAVCFCYGNCNYY